MSLEYGADGHRLGHVAERGSGSVGVDVVDPVRGHPRVLQRQRHGPRAALAVLQGLRDMVGVAAHAESEDLGIDLRPAFSGVFVFLEHEHAGALAEHESVAVAIEGSGRRRGIVIPLRKRLHGRK